MSWTNVAIFEVDPESFLQQFVTVHKTWVYHFQPEMREQSKQWKHPSSPHSRKVRGKMIATIDTGVLQMNYLERGHSNAGVDNADLLRQQLKKIKKM